MSPNNSPIQHFIHRLARCPQEFLAEPRYASRPGIHVDAVVADVLLELSGELTDTGALAYFTPTSPRGRNHLRLVLVASWLLFDPFFRGRRELVEPALTWIRTDLERLSELVDAHAFITDPDRREELSRRCLHALGIEPEGESAAYTADRLAALDSVERERVIRETRAQMERAEELSRRMAEERAREAAARYTRE